MNGVSPSIGTASVILVLGFAGSRALGVVRNIALAGTFGTGPELDAYFAAFRLPDALFQLIVGAALGSAFIPTFANTFTRVSPADAWRLAGAALNIFTLLGAAAAGLGFALAPWLVPLTVPGFPESQQELTVTLTRTMLLSTVFFCASGTVGGILNARGHFLLPAVVPWLYNLSIIGGTWWLSGVFGVLGPAIGVAVGAALHLLIQLPGLARVGMRYTLAFHPKTPGMGEIFRLMGPRVLGLATIQVNWLVTTVLASTLSAGSVAALSYAWAVTMLPLSVFGMAPATAAFPTLAQAAAQEDWARFRHTLSTGLRITLFLTIPSSVGLILLREPLIALLFQRGLFDAASTRLTAFALLFYGGGLFAHVLQEMAARGSYSLRDTKTPFAFASLGMVAHVVFSLLLREPMGVGGLALAMSLAATLETGGLLLALLRRLDGFDWKELVTSGLRTLAATVVMAGAVQGVLAATAGIEGTPGSIVTLAAGMVLGSASYAGTAVVLRCPELQTLWRQFVSRR